MVYGKELWMATSAGIFFLNYPIHWLGPRGEPRSNIVYTYFHFNFHFQVEDNRLSNEFQNNST